MGIEKDTKTILNFLKAIGIEVWIAKNEKFENYPIPFSFHDYEYDTIINFLIKTGAIYSEPSVIIEVSSVESVMIITLDKHIIEKLISLFFDEKWLWSMKNDF